MNIGGLLPLSLSDYPGQAAAVIFTQGCNLRCPFCHNPGLLPLAGKTAEMLHESSVLQTLAERRGVIEHVVVSGGEPTLQPGLAPFLEALQSLGYRVKLDTNGTRPGVIGRLLSRGLLDFIAMDIKAPPHKYPALTGGRAEFADVTSAIDLILSSSIAHQFRTTNVHPLLETADLTAIRRLLPPEASYTIQRFDDRSTLDPALAKGCRPTRPAPGQLPPQCC